MSALIVGPLADGVQCRRVMTLDVEADMFLHLLRRLDNQRRIEVRGLPEDAHCVGLNVDRYLPNVVRLFIESESFSEVPHGSIPAPLRLEFVEHFEATDGATG